MNDKQRYRANEELLAEQTIRVLESRATGSGSKDDQATAELGRLLRDAAKTNLPESNIDLREQLMAELDGGSPAGEQVTVASSEKASSKLASESTGHRRFWIAAAASGLLLVGGAIAYNSDFVGQLSNVALLEQPSERGNYSSVPQPPSIPEPAVVYKYETKTRIVPVTRTPTETKTRQVPINRIREEKKRVKQADGSIKVETVKVPYTEMVTQPYTVNVPFTEQVAQSYTVPVPYTADGKRIEKADYGKFGLDANGRGLKEKMVFRGADEWRKKTLRRTKTTDFRLTGRPAEFISGGEIPLRDKVAGIPEDLSFGNGLAGRSGGVEGLDLDRLDTESLEELESDLNEEGRQGRLARVSRVQQTIRELEEAREKMIAHRDTADRQLVEESFTMQTRSPSGGDRGDETKVLLKRMSDKFHLQVKEIERKLTVLRSAGHNEHVEAERRIIEELKLERDQLRVAQLVGSGHSDTSALDLAISERKRKQEALVRGEVSAGEQYEPIFENAFIGAKGPEAISTFSIDVDTASYANMRRLLNSGQRPPADSIRLEELVNYFQYDYKQPTGEHPFSVNLDLADCPWQDGHQLLRVGLKGKDIHVAERPATNVVFLIDVSGSMSSNDKLPLLKSGFQMMSQKLGENDRVSIVTYAGNAGVVLTPTNGTQTETINNAIQRLSSGGSTHGSAGIKLAYELAQQNFIEGGVNRVMLATDGDLNVGVTSDDALVSLIKEKASEGVFLTVLGFGTGNLKDGKLEKLADNGNGMYAYIDSTREARRVLVDQLSGSLVTIAKDVKIQVEFNPAEVKSYRLLGYENRMLETKDFDDDQKDAGEIGAGHTVTAIYQIEPAKAVTRSVSLPAGMKYQVPTDVNADVLVDGKGDADKGGLSKAAMSGELATVALRYKQPEASESQRLEVSIKNESKRFEEASDDFRFAASVAGLGMYLRNSKHAGAISAKLLQRIASGAIGDDESGYRSEFIDLIRKASGR